jgi:hypothetical protein
MKLNVEAITVTRSAQGSYVSGRFVPGAPTVTTAAGNVQPLSGKELLLLPEGERQRQVVKIYTGFALESGDIVTRADGIQYDVQAVENWTAFAQPHFKARLTRIEGQ